MIDDPAILDRQNAYLDAIRARGRRERSLGLIASLVGVLIVVVARFRLSGEPWALWGGLAIVAAGWGLFVVSVARRLIYVRTHPFDPNSPHPNG